MWIKHPETGAVVEVPREALPMYRQSNWDTLTDEELDEMERARADEVAAAEDAMREQAEIALGAAPAPPPTSPGAEQTGPTRDEPQTVEEN